MKRFWREAATARNALGWQVALDGRPIKTQGGNALVLPTEALAELLAGEWAAQGEEIEECFRGGAFTGSGVSDE